MLNAKREQCPTPAALMFSGLGYLGQFMTKQNVAKVLLFDEEMRNVLLQRDEALTAISCLLRDGTIFQELQRSMHQIIGIDPQHQPFWWRIRAEVFPSSDTTIHVFFGKLSMSELLAIEQRRSAGPSYVIIQTANLYTQLVAPRLRYLIPMAIVLSHIESKYWPQP